MSQTTLKKTRRTDGIVAFVSSLWYSNFGVCFGFRTSDFEDARSVRASYRTKTLTRIPMGEATILPVRFLQALGHAMDSAAVAVTVGAVANTSMPAGLHGRPRLVRMLAGRGLAAFRLGRHPGPAQVAGSAQEGKRLVVTGDEDRPLQGLSHLPHGQRCTGTFRTQERDAVRADDCRSPGSTATASRWASSTWTMFRSCPRAFLTANSCAIWCGLPNVHRPAGAIASSKKNRQVNSDSTRSLV